jgi:hypothetical protein
MHCVRAPHVAEVSTASEGPSNHPAVDAHVVNHEIRDAVGGDPGADPRECVQRRYGGAERDDPDRRARKDHGEEIVRVDVTLSRSVMGAVPYEPAAVHQQAV